MYIPSDFNVTSTIQTNFYFKIASITLHICDSGACLEIGRNFRRKNESMAPDTIISRSHNIQRDDSHDLLARK